MATKREILHHLLTKPNKEKGDRKIKRGIQRDHSVDNTRNTNLKEDDMLDAIDYKNAIVKYAETIEKLEAQKIDIMGFFSKVSPAMAVKLLMLAETAESDKTKLDAVLSLLELAGYSKVQKVAVANVDISTPKQQLQSIIQGLTKNNPDVVLVEDDKDLDTDPEQ